MVIDDGQLGQRAERGGHERHGQQPGGHPPHPGRPARGQVLKCLEGKAAAIEAAVPVGHYADVHDAEIAGQ